MAYIDKYYKGLYQLNGDCIKRSILWHFEAVHNRTANSNVISKMVGNEDMELFLDDEDYEFW